MAASDTPDLAEQLIDLRRYDQAVELLTGSLVGGPADAEAHFLLAVAHQEAGRPEEALAAARTAVGLAPDDQNLKILANVLVQLGRHAEAAEAVRAAPRLDPSDPQRHYLLGAALADQRGHDEQAMAAFEQAARLAPEMVEVHVAMGHLAARARRYDRAEACFQRALALDPGNDGALADIAAMHERKGEDTAAVDWLLRSAAVHPTGPGGLGLAVVVHTTPCCSCSPPAWSRWQGRSGLR
jgi:tetratricopeptide (TPR) repeat protein